MSATWGWLIIWGAFIAGFLVASFLISTHESDLESDNKRLKELLDELRAEVLTQQYHYKKLPSAPCTDNENNAVQLKGKTS